MILLSATKNIIYLVMRSPTIHNGVTRAVGEIAMPSFAILAGVLYARTAWGEYVAGIVFLLMTIGMLTGLYLSAKYWTTTYVAGFSIAGIVLLFSSPDLVSDLVPVPFAYLGTAVVLVFLVLLFRLFLQKAGLLKLLSR